MPKIVRAAVLVAAVAILAGHAVSAQAPERRWRPTVRFTAEARYDDNPFLLTADQRLRLSALSSADVQSGRFTDMDDSRDVIAGSTLELGVDGPGLLGRRVALDVDVTYEANVLNSRRSHVELGVGIKQSLGGGGRLALGADFRPGYFWKNYLADALDANLDGSVAPDERRYAPGTSDEMDLSLGYRQRLIKSRRASPFGLTGEVEVRYYTRSYDAPFASRDRSGPGGAASLQAELGRSWEVKLGYAYASLTSDVTREVAILDEPDFGVDFNGNGNATDLEARAFELVDRSRAEHDFTTGLRGDLGTLRVGVSYGRRWRRFSSVQPYDVSDRGREDTRNEVEVEAEVRMAHGLRLLFGAQLASQRTNRAGDPGSTGEVADYARHMFVTGLRYTF